MSIINKIIRGGGGGSGLSEAQVDARVALYQPASGTFTPTIQDASLSDAEGQTYSEQTGYYRKIGDVCQGWIDMTISGLGTMTGTDAASIGNLPFTAANINAPMAVTVGFSDSLALPSAGQAVNGYIVPNTNRLALTKWSATTGTSNLTITELSAGGRLVISFSYITE